MTKEIIQTARYTNETFSGCDMVVAINMKVNIDGKETMIHKVVGEIQTVSYSINMAKSPIHAIGNVNAKDYVMGKRTIAGSLVFNVFNFHFAKSILGELNGTVSNTNMLVDELPPFDLIISAANEYGYRSKLVIYGVRLLNEGQVMSINDVFTENTYQYYATDLEYLNDEAKYVYNGKNEYGKTKLYTIATTTNVDVKEKEVKAGEMYISWEQKYLPKFNASDKEVLSKDYIDFEERKRELPILDTIIKQPSRVGQNGIVNFILNKVNTESSNFINVIGDDKTLKLKISSLNCSTELVAGRYTAQLESVGAETIRSNVATFTISQITEEDLLNKFAPTIEELYSTRLVARANEPLHTHMQVKSENGEVSYEIIKGKCRIDNLKEDTSYTIMSYGDTGINSNLVSFKTLKNVDEVYAKFERFVYSNSNGLAYPDINRYKKVIKMAMSKYTDRVSEALIILKKELVDKLAGSNSESIKDIKIDIMISSELIAIALKLETDTILISNKNSVKMPSSFYDENKRNCVQMDKSVDKIEVYRLHNNIYKFVESVGVSLFCTINGKTRSHKLKTKAAIKYRVFSFSGKAKSAPLDIYVHTAEDTITLIPDSNSTISYSEEIKIATDVINSYDDKLSDIDVERVMLSKVKIKTNSILSAPSTKIVDDKIIVKTGIYNIQSNLSGVNNYMLAIASKSDVFSNRHMYKVPFTNRDKHIVIDKYENAILEKPYVIWIENSDGIQISDASSFISNYDLNTDLKIYESDFLIDAINKISKDKLETNISNEVKNFIRYDSDVNTHSMIESVLALVLNGESNNNNCYNFTKSIQNLVGIISKPSQDRMKSININNYELEIVTDTDGTVVIIKDDYKGFSNYNILKNNKLKLSVKNKAIVVFISSELIKKSTVYYIEDNKIREV